MRGRIDRGERAPDFVAPSPSGVLTRFYGVAGGRPTALVFGEPVALGAEWVSLIVGEAEGASFVDPEGRVAALYGVTGPAILLLDANLRVLARVDDRAGLEEALERVRGRLQAEVQAPVLLIDDVLEPRETAELIALFEQDGGVETGVELSSEGARKNALDADYKRRRDLTVSDPALLARLTSSIGRRVIPEVHKAFAYKATRFEGFKIARYDAASGGHFRAHRDNLSPATSHRRFALTLNLNAGYEGGHLVFPEYGPQPYRPGAGGAVIFSCSLLHEAALVTRGSRYVLLSFLFDERR